MTNLGKKALNKQRTAKRVPWTGAVAASLILLPGILGGNPALAQKAERNSLTYGELIKKPKGEKLQKSSWMKLNR